MAEHQVNVFLSILLPCLLACHACPSIRQGITFISITQLSSCPQHQHHFVVLRAAAHIGIVSSMHNYATCTGPAAL